MLFDAALNIRDQIQNIRNIPAIDGSQQILQAISRLQEGADSRMYQLQEGVNARMDRLQAGIDAIPLEWLLSRIL